MNDLLPDWHPGTVAILATSGAQPHAIPISTAVRARADTVLLALAAGRESLRRLRADPAVALAVLASDDVAFTAYGDAHVLDEPLSDGVVGVEIEVHQVQDHRRDAFRIDAGVAWRWTDPEAAERDERVRKALARIVADRQHGA